VKVGASVNHNHNNSVFKKANTESSTRVGTIVDRKKVLKQAGVVKSQ